jgi:glycosyltransferase involved in cell wall biosynthesis
LGHQIFLHGAYEHSQLPEILGNLDLVVLPSEWEGLPLVLVEAMQHGVPFVATAAGGTAEFGINNPDVRVTPIEWDSFVEGFVEFACGLRAGAVDGLRLHHWAESRYGYDAVSPQWLKALTEPRAFFGLF